MTTESSPVPSPASVPSGAPVEITGAEAVVRSLEMLGITDVFGLPGGAILPVYDPLFESKKLRHILVRHEQGGGHAAQGYASSSGKLGVTIATSGPGAPRPARAYRHAAITNHAAMAKPMAIFTATATARPMSAPVATRVAWPVPVVGSVVGAFAGSFAGALAAELTLGRSTGHATRVATGALIGRTGAVAVKIAIGFAMAAWLVIAAWR